MHTASQRVADLDDQIAFTLAAEDLFDKCDEELKIRIPSSMKAAVMRAAAARRMPVAAYLRMTIAAALYGPEHIATVVAKRLGMAPQCVPTSVGTHEQGGR